MNYKRSLPGIFILSLLVYITGCSDDDKDSNISVPPAATTTSAPASIMVEYEVGVVNLTFGQPLSPAAFVVHDANYSAFSIGEMASVGLELLAEGGDNSDFLTEAAADANVMSTMSASGPLAPGASESFTVTLEEGDLPGTMLSAVSMLVNSNDAFTAFQDVSLENMEIGQSMQFTTISYDSGTETNSELAGTVPGPADGGEGFNAARDDVADAVRGHPGVVTAADGLMASVLGEAHRWDNPVAHVTITRIR